MRALRQAWVVLGKELQDALRDRRTLVVVFLSSVLMGPLLLAMLSALVSTLEQKAEQRELLVVGMAHSPQLHNYLLRQIWQVRPAPEGYEQQLRQGHLTDPVLVVPENFDADVLGCLPVIPDGGWRIPEVISLVNYWIYNLISSLAD